MTRLRLIVAVLTTLGLTACSSLPEIPEMDTSRSISPEPVQEITVTEELGIPETSIRAPAQSPIVATDAQKILGEGLFAFYGTNQSEIHQIKTSRGNYEIQGVFGSDNKRVFSWSYGSSTLFRKGRAISDWGHVYTSSEGKNTLRVKSAGPSDLNFKARLISYDISGKVIREFIRDSNNQLEDLAFHAPGHLVFPEGSRAYHVIYTLANDEIVRPSATAFTGAQTLEQLRSKFSNLINPFCMNYINLEDAKAYGVIFDSEVSFQSLKNLINKQKQKLPTQGTYQLIDTNKDSIFCQFLGTKTVHKGNWRIRTIQGTRVLELDTPANIASTDFGIQPINQKATRVAFAEIYPDGAPKKNQKTKVVPVRVIKKNEPIIDFRLKFNKVAADAMRETLLAAKRVSSRN